MFKKIYHATHPDMMHGATTQQLRDRYLIADLFSSDAIALNYSHNERFVVGGAMPQTKALRLPDFAMALGAVADLVVLDALNAREAFATRSPRRWVIRKGRLIAETRLEVCRHFDIAATPLA